jgi:NADH dehydrogenase
MRINIPETDQQRIVIIGGGFAGLSVARRLAKSNYQIVLIDKHNFHQFQPLFYQVAMAGLEPSSIVFPFRKLLRNHSNVFIRITDVLEVDMDNNRVATSLGLCNFDHLVIAIGATTNYYGNAEIEKHALPMKTIGEAMYLRNTILTDYEIALTTADYEERQGYLDIVIVGGGPTGVELAGALAEMRQYIIPKEYPELKSQEIDIYLIQSAPQLLKGMSDAAAGQALKYLQEMGVEVRLNTRVNSYDGIVATLSDTTQIRSKKVIWAAGIHGNTLKGLPSSALASGNRLLVDRFSKVSGTNNIYAIGDIALMKDDTAFADGHPQVAQVAIQQGNLLAENFKRASQQKPWKPFAYADKGSMATVGRNRAVVDLLNFHFRGMLAWGVWLLVHLFAILGTKNKVFVFINWVWNYITYDQSLRLILKAKSKEEQ